MSVERILIAYCPGFMQVLLTGRYPLQERERSHRIISFCTGEEKAFPKWERCRTDPDAGYEHVCSNL